MEANRILNADLLDLLFEDRNKAYGAYELRRSYHKRITRALLLTAGITTAIFAGMYISKALKGTEPTTFDSRDVVLTDIQPQQEEKKVEPPPPPPKILQPPPKVQMTQFTPPEIVNDNDVRKEDMPPEMEQVADTRIGVMNQAGEIDEGIAAPPVVDDRSVFAPLAKEDDDAVRLTVEVEAEFPGGASAWVRFLQKNLNPNVPIDNGAPEGSYTVIIQFIVNKQGNVSDIKALTSHGYGMEEEAIRVMKKAIKWTPAIQNGHNVNAYRKQPITFVVATQ